MTDGNPMSPSQCRAWSTIEFARPADFWAKLEAMHKTGVPFVATPRTLTIERDDDDDEDDQPSPPLPAPTA